MKPTSRGRSGSTPTIRARRCRRPRLPRRRERRRGARRGRRGAARAGRSRAARALRRARVASGRRRRRGGARARDGARLLPPTGTCAIGRSSTSAAACSGYEGLVVADASMMPTIPRANTNLTVAAVAERLADAGGGDVTDVDDVGRSQPKVSRIWMTSPLADFSLPQTKRLDSGRGGSARPSGRGDRVEGLDHVGVRVGALDLLGERVVVGDRERRREALAEVERVGDVPQRLAGEVLGAGRVERLERGGARRGIDDDVAEEAASA